MNNQFEIKRCYERTRERSMSAKYLYVIKTCCCEDLEQFVAYDHVYSYAQYKDNHRKDDFISSIIFVIIILNGTEKGNYYGY